VLNTVPMEKIRIVFLESSKEKVIAALHKIGTIDFRKSSLELIEDQPLKFQSQIAEQLIRLEGALALMHKPEKPIFKKIKHMPIEKLLKTAAHIKQADILYSMDAKLHALDEEAKQLEYAIYVAKGLACINIDLGKLESESLGFECFTGNDTNANRKLIEQIKHINNVETKVCKNAKKLFVLIAFEKSKEAEISALLSGRAGSAGSITKIDLHSKYLAGKPKEVQANAEKMLEKNKKEKEMAKEEIEEISRKSYWYISGIVELLHIELDRANASAMFKKTERTTIAEGWIPKERHNELVNTLKDATGGDFFIQELQDNELAPTLLKHGRLFKPFDYLMEFFSLPRSDEIDPTWIFIFSFLIFYGFMVSDVGYGILSFIMATLIAKKTNPEGLAHNAAKVWQIGAVPAAIFGVITNQYFGIGLDQYFMPFKGISWTKNVQSLLLLSIFIGVAQVILGLLFGMVNEYRRHRKKKAVSKIMDIGAMLLGIVALASGLFGVFNASIGISTGIGAAVLFVLSLLIGDLHDAISIIVHPLSYARLMGFGLTSVIMAALIDMAFTPTLTYGVIAFVLLIIAFVALHTLNMILSVFEGIIQGARLNFVEFFSKFYEGGGIKFKPFGYKRIFTKE